MCLVLSYISINFVFILKISTCKLWAYNRLAMRIKIHVYVFISEFNLDWMASSQWWASSQMVDFFINIGLNNYVTLTIKDCGVLRPSMVSTSLVTCGYSSPSLGTWMGCELGLERLCGCTIEPSFHWLALKAPWSKLGSSSSTPHLKNSSKIKVHLWRSTCDMVDC